jgi:hypothetical protein
VIFDTLPCSQGTRVIDEPPRGQWGFPPQACRSRYQDVTADQLHELLSVDVEGWLAEIPLIREHFERFGTHLPKDLSRELDDLDRRLRLSTTKTGKLSRFGKVGPARQENGTLAGGPCF